MSNYKLIINLQNTTIDTNALQKMYNFPLDKEFYIHGLAYYDNSVYKCLIFEQIFIETTFCK
ncbi:MAG: hypothetical protein JXR68_06835 [Bacteroidales bacterium]|nr:hypothetical protein [Bacteroidales bacterium]